MIFITANYMLRHAFTSQTKSNQFVNCGSFLIKASRKFVLATRGDVQLSYSNLLFQSTTAHPKKINFLNFSTNHGRYNCSLSSLRPSRTRLTSSFMIRSPSFLQKSLKPVTTNIHIGSLSYFSSRPPFGSGGKGGNRWMRGAGLVGAASVMFGKTKYILGALKLTKFASLGSMIFTIGTYTMFFGLPYAVGMVGLVTVHEIGHALVMYQRGIPFSPMVFMPFMGAMIQMNRNPRDAWEDALVAFGGPALGSLGAVGVAGMAHMTDSQLLFALADFGFMINMFNLMPLGSMDGGRIAGALTPWANVVGLGMGGALAMTGAIMNPIFYIILLSGGWQTYQRFSNPGAVPPNYYRITTMQRTVIGLGYAGLIGSLAFAMDRNQSYKKSTESLIREREMEKRWDMR